MFEALPALPPQAPQIGHSLLILIVAALLGAALGLIRPGRREIVPRSAHIVQTQVLLALVGAVIIVVVEDSLARAFAVVGAAGLVRYRARVEDVKDAGVMLISLALGLTAGSGMFLFGFVACAFVIGVLWILESSEPPARSRFALKVEADGVTHLRADIERALAQAGVHYELRGSSPKDLHYEVSAVFHQDLHPLTGLLQGLNDREGASVDWEIKKWETVAP